MIIISGRLRYDVSRQADAIAVVKEAAAATRAEDGNRAYDWGFDVEDPSVVHVFEAWTDQAAIDAHMASPHLAALMGAMGDLGVTEVEFVAYEAGEPTKIL